MRVANLPKSFGELTNLEALDMSECQNLGVLPESFGGLTKLKELKLDGICATWRCNDGYEYDVAVKM